MIFIIDQITVARKIVTVFCGSCLWIAYRDKDETRSSEKIYLNYFDSINISIYSSGFSVNLFKVGKVSRFSLVVI